MKLSLSIELYRHTHTTHRSLEYLLCTLTYGSVLGVYSLIKTQVKQKLLSYGIYNILGDTNNKIRIINLSSILNN